MRRWGKTAFFGATPVPRTGVGALICSQPCCCAGSGLEGPTPVPRTGGGLINFVAPVLGTGGGLFYNSEPRKAGSDEF